MAWFYLYVGALPVCHDDDDDDTILHVTSFSLSEWRDVKT